MENRDKYTKWQDTITRKEAVKATRNQEVQKKFIANDVTQLST